MKEQNFSIGQWLDRRLLAPKQVFKAQYAANYFTLLFSLGLLLTPSALSAQTCSGNANTVVSQTGVDNPTEALGNPNGTAAQLWDTGDQIVLDLNNVVNAGATLVLTWRGNLTSSADPIITVETSLDGATFTAVSGGPFTLTRQAAYFTNNIVTPSSTRYVRLTTTNVFNVDLDAVTFTNQTCSPICGTNTAGTVWRDFNNDGVKNANEAEGVPNVTVRAYDCNNALAETATTDANGAYAFTSLTPSTTNRYRIEFSGGTPQYQPTFSGANGKTDVQFIAAATCFADMGINNPVDYCQPNPALSINCYVSGAYNSSSGTGRTIVALPYNITQDPDGNTNGTTATGNTVPNSYNPPIYTPARPMKTPIADHNEVASTWGLAYDRVQRNLFAAAYVKAGTSLGPNGESTGKIYKINNPLSTSDISDYVDLNTVFSAGTAGVNPHPIATTSFANLDDAATNAAIGKVGLGDLAISNDNAFLYVVNLSDRQLYKIPTSGALNSTTITRFPIPTTGLPTVTDAIGTAGTCPNGDMRPFGLGVHPDGSIYVGGVCSAESISAGFNAVNNPASYQVTAYVWKFDGTAFTLQLNESLRFDRDGGNGYTTFDDFATGNPRQNDWEPWHNLSNAAIYNADNPAQNEPMLADISFDEKGDMFLGMRDRLGDCVTLQGGFLSSGDIYKACNTTTGWKFEKNATCGLVTTSGANNNQGPGGGEFIYQDIQGDGLANSGTGGVFNLMGQYQVISTTIDPVYLNSSGASFFNPSAGGVQVFGTQDGRIKGAYDIYEINDINTFAKAAGVGAIAALCDPAPLQIGNYVWIDTDRDGVQDPCEGPLSNVALSLWKGGVQIATTTTNANGNYAFTGIGAPNETWTATSGTDSILPNMAYEVRISTTQTGIVTPNYSLTTANSTTNSGNDQNDSDAALFGTNAVIAFTTGAAGSTSHTLDFGFSLICSINLTTNVSGCYDSNGNAAGGSSVATVQAIVDWSNNPSGETINVSCTGAASQSINPATASKPAILTFTVPANGAAITVTAAFSTATTCAATKNTTAPNGNCLLTPCEAGNTGGTVWKDYNGDGVKDATETQGLEGVTVKAYDCNNVLVGTTITDAKGQYTFGTLSPAPSATNKLRIEFSGGPPQYKPTFNGANGRTDVQFISAASCAIDFGVNAPADYCQANPNLAVPCYVNGNPLGGGTSGAADWLVAFPYDITGTTAPPTHLDGTVLGTVWGQGYQRQSKKLFSAAYVKRHSGLGTYSTDGSSGAGPISGTDSGSGGIYVTDFSGGTPVISQFVNLQALGIETGDFASARNLPSGKLTPNQDIAAFDKVSKAGLGDLDLSEDEQTMFVTNLFDREIYQLSIGSIGTAPTSATALPNAPWLSGSPCNNGVARPFGLKVRGGKLYVGVVCTAENGGTFSDLNATVHAYDLTAGTWETAINFPLNYTRGLAYESVPASNKWYPWTDVMNSIPNFLGGGALQVSYPTPVLSDIEFDEKNNMILAFTDRTGDQIGSSNYGVYNTTDLYYYVLGGDILKAGYDGSGQWLLENNGTVGGNTTTGAGNNQGPGGGEFFPNEAISPGHQETTVGSLAYLMGKNEVALTAMDPLTSYTAGGLAWFNSTTGAKNRGYQLYIGANTSNGAFGKANGLGDLELMCNPAPIEVGNYVWIDTDKDGVQDPCEGPLSMVTVSLWKGGTQIATTTTNASGEYYFSSKSNFATPADWTGTGADTTLLPNMAYEVRIDTAAQSTIFSNLALTTANATANTGNDQNDNDATTSGVYKVIAFTTGAAGSTNHTYDFGFQPVCIPPTITSVNATSATCINGVANSNAEVHVTGITGMTKYAYKTNATDSLWANTATASTTTSIDLTGLANPSVATTYTFRVWGVDTTCYNDTTVVLNPVVCPPCSIVATFTQGGCNNNGTAAITTDDYFTVAVSAVSSTNGGTSGKYEVMLNGTVLNTGGTAYGTPVTVGGILDFKSDGATTYNLTVRDVDITACTTTVFTTAASAACSTIGCKPVICLPVTVTVTRL